MQAWTGCTFGVQVGDELLHSRLVGVACPGGGGLGCAVVGPRIFPGNKLESPLPRLLPRLHLLEPAPLASLHAQQTWGNTSQFISAFPYLWGMKIMHIHSKSRYRPTPVPLSLRPLAVSLHPPHCLQQPFHALVSVVSSPQPLASFPPAPTPAPKLTTTYASPCSWPSSHYATQNDVPQSLAL